MVFGCHGGHEHDLWKYFWPEMLRFILGFWIWIYLKKFVGMKCIWVVAEMYLSWVDMYGLWKKYVWDEIVDQF
jgi:hypothetical protein